MDDMTIAEKRILDRDKLHHEITGNLFYTDDTIIMISTPESAQLVLRKMQQESKTYVMKLNQTKSEHIRLNAIHRTQFENGEEVPTAQSAAYLGSGVQYNGDHKCEINN